MGPQRRVRAVLVTAWCALVAFSGGCATSRFAGASLAAPTVVSSGAKARGDSCVVHVLGLPLGQPRADQALARALDAANDRDGMAPHQEYDALLDVDVEERLGVFTRCIVVEGTPARVTGPDHAGGTP